VSWARGFNSASSLGRNPALEAARLVVRPLLASELHLAHHEEWESAPRVGPSPATMRRAAAGRFAGGTQTGRTRDEALGTQVAARCPTRARFASRLGGRPTWRASIAAGRAGRTSQNAVVKIAKAHEAFGV
jgi:hypothetical protein